MSSNYFDRLGLPRRFLVDTNELERAYLAQSRAVHPDYHLGGSSAEFAVSLELSAALNEAYNTLRDPLARAEYLLALEGGPSASQCRQIPAAFLAQMLDAREEAQGARDDPTERQRLEANYSAQFDMLMNEVGALFEQVAVWPPGTPERADVLMQIRTLLNAAKYVRGLIRDLSCE